MTRSEARTNAFILLFQMDFSGKENAEEIKKIYFDEHPEIVGKDRKFIESRADGASEHIEEIDQLIGANAKGWTIERMSKVDLAILRLAVFELKFSGDTPAGVAINEAVELAKAFSSDSAPAFINGILGKIA